MSNRSSVIVFPVSSLNHGNVIEIITTARTSEKKLVNNASPMNCATSIFLWAPITLRSPTSLPRFADREVARFIKLITAIMSTRTAMNEKR